MVRRAPVGITLVELLVVLAMLGLMAGMVGLAGRVEGPPESSGVLESVAALRRRAIESGRAAQAVLSIEGRSVQVLALPDGRILGAEAFNVSLLIGANDATHSR